MLIGRTGRPVGRVQGPLEDDSGREAHADAGPGSLLESSGHGSAICSSLAAPGGLPVCQGFRREHRVKASLELRHPLSREGIVWRGASRSLRSMPRGSPP